MYAAIKREKLKREDLAVIGKTIQRSAATTKRSNVLNQTQCLVEPRRNGLDAMATAPPKLPGTRFNMLPTENMSNKCKPKINTNEQQAKSFMSRPNNTKKSELKLLYLGQGRLLGGEMKKAREPKKSQLKEQSAENRRQADYLRRAVHEGGGSTDPEINAKLRDALRNVDSERLQPHNIQGILRECEQFETRNSTYILHISYRQLVYLVCSVRTQNLLRMKRELTALLKENNAAFFCSSNIFNDVGIIDAIVSYQTPVDFNDFDEALRRDAFQCRANHVEIVNYETGAVCFKCNPMHLNKVAYALKQLGYKVLNTEHGFQSLKPIQLRDDQYKEYMNFLHELQKYEDIINVYDNVKRPAGDELFLKNAKNKKQLQNCGSLLNTNSLAKMLPSAAGDGK